MKKPPLWFFTHLSYFSIFCIILSLSDSVTQTAGCRPQASKFLLPSLSKGGIPLFGKEGLGEILEGKV
jgi:hypothetical protein